ncbi:thyrotroph embryonic factor-like isoform X2 [Ptychodera flava]|uniref:thyrotroph embryonic factor-like isoform X2 n=1 Tax=Ptychodera flava TaxID=63121 RepID=UPI00396A8DCD
MAEDKLYDFQPFDDSIDKQKIPPISTFAKPTGYDGGYSQPPNPAAFYVVAAGGNQSFVYPATSNASSTTATSQGNASHPSNMVSSMPNNPGSGLETPMSGTLPPTPPVSADEKDNNNDDPDGKNAALARILTQSKPLGGYPTPISAPQHFIPPPPTAHTPIPGPMSPIGMDPLAAYARSRAPPKRRSSKKPVSDEMKDDKYFERRKKNNMAAKRSRDARKMREEDVARRAAFLEKENAQLRTQLETLKEEAYALRQLLAQKSNS